MPRLQGREGGRGTVGSRERGAATSLKRGRRDEVLSQEPVSGLPILNYHRMLALLPRGAAAALSIPARRAEESRPRRGSAANTRAGGETHEGGPRREDAQGEDCSSPSFSSSAACDPTCQSPRNNEALGEPGHVPPPPPLSWGRVKVKATMKRKEEERLQLEGGLGEEPRKRLRGLEGASDAERGRSHGVSALSAPSRTSLVSGLPPSPPSTFQFSTFPLILVSACLPPPPFPSWVALLQLHANLLPLVVCNLKNFSRGRVGFRWRSSEEARAGVGEVSCGNLGCASGSLPLDASSASCAHAARTSLPSSRAQAEGEADEGRGSPKQNRETLIKSDAPGSEEASSLPERSAAESAKAPSRRRLRPPVPHPLFVSSSFASPHGSASPALLSSARVFSAHTRAQAVEGQRATPETSAERATHARGRTDAALEEKIRAVRTYTLELFVRAETRGAQQEEGENSPPRADRKRFACSGGNCVASDFEEAPQRVLVQCGICLRCAFKLHFPLVVREDRRPTTGAAAGDAGAGAKPQKLAPGRDAPAREALRRRAPGSKAAENRDAGEGRNAEAATPQQWSARASLSRGEEEIDSAVDAFSDSNEEGERERDERAATGTDGARRRERQCEVDEEAPAAQARWRRAAQRAR
ncbi:hypothetical protein BESB_002020 [Besnoitia besnoiti]|uniref:Uncharacterized protein n=1 Tax=Besnoitia besnoiti TaxID=94643 RepID=A0A2A9MN07_BESBE|nr:hypothetical protein BESB_002020 [Besnoitia besnoiti]PFH37861.1 hypothetical protein BESB_002020 [Besnoitia besnoiti]